MDQFLSRFTFGLLMAQVFPGGVFLLSLTSPLRASRGTPVTSMSQLVLAVGNFWFGSTTRTVLFLFLAGSLGMLIHGLSWMVMAWLENHLGGPVTKVRDSFWHNWKLGYQVLVAPVKMVGELGWALRAQGIEQVTMEESGSHISPLDKPLFDFFEDFYLYFAQFYAHTAYALLASIFLIAWTWLIIGWTWRRGAVLVLLYFATSIFFLIGRTQFASLFKSENVFRNRAGTLTPGL